MLLVNLLPRISCEADASNMARNESLSMTLYLFKLHNFWFQGPLMRVLLCGLTTDFDDGL
jgi:hypothetical protein